MDDDREIWKRLIYANKAKHIEDFKKIEDNYNKNYEASIQFLKRISDNRRIPADQNIYMNVVTMTYQYWKNQFLISRNVRRQ